MKFLLTILLPIFILGQSWTDPVQISTLQGLNNNPDFCIGNDGSIHCVWSYRFNQYHRVIFYSKSTDEGSTWSNPEIISQNDTLWMENPHIVADSENNLHLTYDYNVISPGATLIMYRYYNGETWTEADTVSPGWYGARHNRLVIDNNDLLYSFWFHGIQNGTAMYRVLENGVWGDLHIPYDNYDLVGFQKGVVDENNNIYCTGVHHYEGQSAYEDRVISFSFINNTWQPWEQLSNDKSWGGIDIGLSSTNHPAIVWGQDISDSYFIDDGTFFSYYNGTNWSTPELIVENAYEQAIAIDMYDHVHIVNLEEYDDVEGLVHYQKMNDEWIGEIIEENQFGFYHNTMISRNNFLYMVNDEVINLSPDYNSSIVFRKYDVLTDINQHQNISIESIKVFPNPAIQNITISYALNEPTKTEIEVYDYKGRFIKTLFNNYQSSGTHKLYWDLTANNGYKVKQGAYFIKTKAGKYIMTRRVVIVN